MGRRMRIKANTLAINRRLDVYADGVSFCETALFDNTRRFKFSDIQLVLISPDNTLSFQVGLEVFSIPTKPTNARHQKAIAALLEGVRYGQGVAY